MHDRMEERKNWGAVELMNSLFYSGWKTSQKALRTLWTNKSQNNPPNKKGQHHSISYVTIQLHSNPVSQFDRFVLWGRSLKRLGTEECSHFLGTTRVKYCVLRCHSFSGNDKVRNQMIWGIYELWNSRNIKDNPLVWTNECSLNSPNKYA